MKPQEMKAQFMEVERSVSHAATACEQTGASSAALRRRLADWSRQCRALRSTLDKEGDPSHIREELDDLERTGARLVRVCRRISVDDEIEHAVEHAHAALSDLHRRLH